MIEDHAKENKKMIEEEKKNKELKKIEVGLSQSTIDHLVNVHEIEIGTDSHIHGLDAALNRYLALKRKYSDVVMVMAGGEPWKNPAFPK
jgi:hypothetical protein